MSLSFVGTGAGFWRQFTTFFLPVAAILGIAFATFHYQDFASEREKALLQAQTSVDHARRSVSRDFDAVVSDLQVLAEGHDLRALASRPGDPELRAVVARDFIGFARNKRVYDQVRYLDASGQEVVRVDWNRGKPAAVPEVRLQDKSGRYYFRDALKLSRGGIYVSALDLNVEHGGIETPYKPMIRFATPVMDDQGRKQGVLVLNYLGARLIDNLRSSMDVGLGTGMLVDNRGYWLFGPDPGLEWGFMFSDGRRFPDMYPRVWTDISAGDSGQLLESLGLFTFVTIYPLQEVAAYLEGTGGHDVAGPAEQKFWKVISFLDSSAFASASRRRAETGLVLYLVLMGLWAVASTQIARLRSAGERSRNLITRLSSVVEQTSDIVYITDRRGVIEYINPSFERITGYGADEAVGRDPRLLKSGEHDRAFYQRMWKTIAAGESYQDVVTNRTKDGTLYYEQKTITPLKDRHGRTTHYVSTGKDITEQMLAQERLYHLAFHNPLTDLPNRNLFRDRLSRAAAHAHRAGHLIALLFLDLDHFKNVNDSLGHEAGDRLLEEVARSLQESVRESDTVAHVGGDEFAIILDEVHHVEQVAMVAEKILAALKRPFALNGTELFVGASIGIVLYPTDESDIDQLIKAADTAMYRAKELGRNRYVFYSRDMTSRITARMNLESELRRAMDRREFILYYQPVIALSDGQVQGVEALVRWNHPDKGVLEPDEFIPVLEESGLIVPVTRWILQEACTHSGALRAAGVDTLSVAVNFSPRCFTGKGILELVSETLSLGCIAPSQLVVEITENTLMENQAVIGDSLQELRRLGVRIAIDDFGTGYSSFGYLKRFPADILKIDREFIRNLPDSRDDAALVSAMIAMSHSLNIKVVAEGAETPGQLDFLRERGCDAVQGFLFGTPMAQDMAAMMIQRKPPPWDELMRRPIRRQGLTPI
jgi:diguanylate cyclase (GGDEF)-like protein/PAS domain S-box-containing protein